MIIGIAGAVVGLIVGVTGHPNADEIWLAQVDLGNGAPVQIVFGGNLRLLAGDLVPAAPPGSKAVTLSDKGPGTRKIRARRYRGTRSHGMLCSLSELGWLEHSPDEVALLVGLPPGHSLDDVPVGLRAGFVLGWGRSWKIADQASKPDRAPGPPPA